MKPFKQIKTSHTQNNKTQIEHKELHITMAACGERKGTELGLRVKEHECVSKQTSQVPFKDNVQWTEGWD